MNNISVVNFGVAALMIRLDAMRIFVDAFNTMTEPPDLSAGDIVLVTHDDGDHFDADKMPCIKGKEITVIGPPSVVKPLLESDKAYLNQIQIIYSPNNHEPNFIDTAGVRIAAYRTPHFLDWKPIHNSYLIQHKQQSIYITGDSYLTAQMKGDIGGVDIVICNLVEEGYITGRDDKRFAVHRLMSYLTDVMAAYSPQRIVGVHLIDFDGTINPLEMKKLAADYHFDEIIIPIGKDEITTLI